jgi:hypothetical protein
MIVISFKKYISRMIIVCVFLILNAGRSDAQLLIRDINDENQDGPNVFWMPYIFSTETFDLGVGAGAVVSGYPQEQSTMYGTAFGTANGSWRIWAGAYDLRVPYVDRLFFTPDISATRYENVQAYINGDPDFPDQEAGAHGSDPENYIRDSGWDGFIKLNFRYVLPMGHGKDHIVNRIKVDRGLRHSDPVGGTSWNPLKSGRSYIFVEPFYRSQGIELETGTREIKTSGARFEIMHDNTDFRLNPSFGDLKRLAVTRDPGTQNSKQDWTWLEAEYQLYIPLGNPNNTHMNTLALTAWWSDIPTWQLNQDGDDITRTHAPPYFEGSTLGGFDRMRAYPDNRFFDRSAVYYSAEYRVIPKWNPMRKVSILGTPRIDWVQWVFFAELGRVASDFDLEDLHTDMNFDAGIGMRIYAEGIVGRLDLSASDEGTTLIVMVGHPF